MQAGICFVESDAWQPIDKIANSRAMAGRIAPGVARRRLRTSNIAPAGGMIIMRPKSRQGCGAGSFKPAGMVWEELHVRG